MLSHRVNRSDQEFHALPIKDQLREETLAMMLQDGELDEATAVAILECEQMGLFDERMESSQLS